MPLVDRVFDASRSSAQGCAQGDRQGPSGTRPGKASCALLPRPRKARRLAACHRLRSDGHGFHCGQDELHAALRRLRKLTRELCHSNVSLHSRRVAVSHAANARFPPILWKNTRSRVQNFGSRDRLRHLSCQAFRGFCGRGKTFASFRRFWAVAASRNSSFAPHGPRSLSLRATRPASCGLRRDHRRLGHFRGRATRRHRRPYLRLRACSCREGRPPWQAVAARMLRTWRTTPDMRMMPRGTSALPAQPARRFLPSFSAFCPGSSRRGQVAPRRRKLAQLRDRRHRCPTCHRIEHLRLRQK